MTLFKDLKNRTLTIEFLSELNSFSLKATEKHIYVQNYEINTINQTLNNQKKNLEGRIFSKINSFHTDGQFPVQRVTPQTGIETGNEEVQRED